MILKCCIIDDEPLAIELLESYVQRTSYLELVDSFSSAMQAVERIMKGDIDLVFCDIQMPNLSGLEFSRLVEGKTRIIFTTAFDRYAVESYKVNAIDYLLKPIDYTEFVKATQKALKVLSPRTDTTDKSRANNEKYIYVKSDYKLRQVFINKILYIEGLKDYVKFYIEGEEHPLVSLLSLKALEEMLPEGFLRVHRSYIVQCSKIKTIERNRIVFGNTYIPIGDTYRTRVNEFIEQHSPFCIDTHASSSTDNGDETK